MHTWTLTHPTEPGVYWVSVEPKSRPPCHWEKQELPPVFRILVTPTGDVWEIDWKKTEPTYNLAKMPSLPSGVKYCDAAERRPADPWKPREYVGK